MKGRRVTQQCGGFTGCLKDAADDGGHCNGPLLISVAINKPQSCF